MRAPLDSPKPIDYQNDPIPEVNRWENALSARGSDIDLDCLICADMKSLKFLNLLPACGDGEQEVFEILELDGEDFYSLDLDDAEAAIRGSLAAKRLAVRRGLQSLEIFVNETLKPSDLPLTLFRHLSRAVQHAACEMLNTYYELERERLALAKPEA